MFPSTRPRTSRRDWQSSGWMITVSVCCMVAALTLFTNTCSVSATTLATPINGAVNLLYISTLQKAAVAYRLQDPTFDHITMTQISGSSAGNNAIATGAYDFVVSTGTLPTSMQSDYPNIQSYPIMMNAYAPFYNLPDSVGTAPLVLTMLAACQIWRGNITMWNDPRLVATNPLLNLPNQPIQFVMNGFANDGHTACSRLCTKVDPVWAATIGITAMPKIPIPYLSIPVSASSPGGASIMVDLPYTFGWNSMTVTPTVQAIKVASLINQAGKVVTPTPTTISQNFLELAMQGLLTGGTSFDLTNPQSTFAWPVCMSSFIMIDTADAETTCGSKKKLLKFLLWLYTSSQVSDIANLNQVVMLPQLYLEETGLVSRLRREILCAGVELVPLDTTSAVIQGNALMKKNMALLTSLYQSVDSSYLYGFTTVADSLALSRVGAGEIDFALVNPNFLADADIAAFTSSDVTTAADGSQVVKRGGMLFPAYLTGVTLVYSLPAAITALYATWSVTNTLGGLPAIYPLKLDVPTVGLIFSGQITSWTDPAIIALNPQLQPWFDRTNATTTLFTVTCCTVGTTHTDPMIASYILQQHVFTNLSTAATTPTAFYQNVIKTTGITTMSIVENEERMATKVITKPGSISYKMMTTATSALTTEFRIVHATTKQVMEPTPVAMQACLADKMDIGGTDTFNTVMTNAYTRNFVSNTPGCYPLTSHVAIAVASEYSDLASNTVNAAASVTSFSASTCARGKSSLKMIEWMISNDVLSVAAGSIGLFRITDYSALQNYVIDAQLNSATCDGTTILIVLPIVWKINSAIGVVSVVVCLISFLVCAVTLAIMWYYRHAPIWRGSSPSFLAQTLFGLMLLTGALITWTTPTRTYASCQAFQWLSNLGFTFAFAPLFAKTWRIYSIFSIQKMKVVKISNSRLMYIVGAMYLFDLVILSIWSGVSPLKPILYERASSNANGAINQLTHCSVDAAGFTFVGIEAVSKGVLLIFGAMMSFTTRKVSSHFNESQSIAWSIYNIIFVSIIVGAIILFLNTLGDTLIVLIGFLLMWIIYCTWFFIFSPKITHTFSKKSEKENLSINPSSVQTRSSQNGFEFIDLVGLTLTQLYAYSHALNEQVDKVRAKINVMSNGRARDSNQSTVSTSKGEGGKGTTTGGKAPPIDVSHHGPPSSVSPGTPTGWTNLTKDETEGGRTGHLHRVESATVTGDSSSRTSALTPVQLARRQLSSTQLSTQKGVTTPGGIGIGLKSNGRTLSTVNSNSPNAIAPAPSPCPSPSTIGTSELLVTSFGDGPRQSLSEVEFRQLAESSDSSSRPQLVSPAALAECDMETPLIRPTLSAPSSFSSKNGDSDIPNVVNTPPAPDSRHASLPGPVNVHFDGAVASVIAQDESGPATPSLVSAERPAVKLEEVVAGESPTAVVTRVSHAHRPSSRATTDN